MALTTRHSLIKGLQATMPRGAPFDLAMLGEHGISAQLAAKHAQGGWLVRIAQGVYAFPGDPLTMHGCIKFLQIRTRGLHVAGKSALGLQGVRHNLSPQEQLVLWGDERLTLPAWFVSRFPSQYQAAAMFVWPDQALNASTLTTPPGTTTGLRVSVPERAVLEMLYAVGVQQDLEEAHNLFAGLRNLRKHVLGNLLACCTSVKTVRLFMTWSREFGVIDVDSLRNDYKISVGSNRRWMTRMKDGTLLVLKP